jgi:hypothetical protein
MTMILNPDLMHYVVCKALRCIQWCKSWLRQVQHSTAQHNTQVCACLGMTDHQDWRCLQGDFPAQKMIDAVPGVDEARKAKLIKVLDIDPTWRMHQVGCSGGMYVARCSSGSGSGGGSYSMLFVCVMAVQQHDYSVHVSRCGSTSSIAQHLADSPPAVCTLQVSDGQRRRVQICVGLLRPFKVLLLDEITVDLDVLGRWRGHSAGTAGSTASSHMHHSTASCCSWRQGRRAAGWHGSCAVVPA